MASTSYIRKKLRKIEETRTKKEVASKLKKEVKKKVSTTKKK